MIAHIGYCTVIHNKSVINRYNSVEKSGERLVVFETLPLFRGMLGQCLHSTTTCQRLPRSGSTLHNPPNISTWLYNENLPSEGTNRGQPLFMFYSVQCSISGLLYIRTKALYVRTCVHVYRRDVIPADWERLPTQYCIHNTKSTQYFHMTIRWEFT